MNEAEIAKIKEAARLLVEVMGMLSDRKKMDQDDMARLLMSHLQEQMMLTVAALDDEDAQRMAI